MAARYSTTKGFARTSALLQSRIRKAGESRGFAVTRLLTHWPEVVGEDIAAIARPVDVKYGRSGGFGATLTLLTTGAQAPMLEMQKDQIRQKVNGVYGYNAIARIRITQT
ncbi:MAG: RNA-binding protein, partial [Rhodobacteraceae bacterium]|nr:RNA-binding protein [Paracoccaceae bacterium]